MADDALSVITAASATVKVRSREIASATAYSQKVDVAPWMPTCATTAQNQYNQTAGSAVFTATVPSGFTHALVSVEAADVKMTEDGATPSSTVGLFLAEGFVGELALPNAPKFIRAAGVDAKVNLSYRKYS